jgi:hypothetical protein
MTTVLMVDGGLAACGSGGIGAHAQGNTNHSPEGGTSGAIADAASPPSGDAQVASVLDAGVLCGTSPSPVYAFWKGPSVYLVQPDGSIRSVHTAVSQDPQQQMYGVYDSLVSGGRYIAGSAVFNPMNAGGPSSAERFLLDRDGTTVWQTYTSSPGVAVFLGRDGTAAFTDSVASLAGGNIGIANSSVLVARSGTSWSFPGLVVLGPPDDNGVAIVENVADHTLGWVRAGDTAMEPLQTPLVLTPPAQANTNVGSVWSGPRFLIDGTAASGTRIVSALPGDERLVRFQDASVDLATLSLPGSLWPAQDESNWVLATDANNNWRIDVQGALATAFSVSVPAGLRSGQTWTRPKVDDTGKVLSFFRDNNAGGIYLSADGTGNWTRLGHPIANVLVVDVDSHSGTYQIEASDTAYVGETWTGASPPSDALGASTQIVRPADQAMTILPPTIGGSPALVSSDGLCAAWWGGQTASLSILDVRSGRITQFNQAGPPDTPLGLSVWVDAQ